MPADYRAFPILYVDDERQNLVTFRYALEDGFTVLTAESGREALRLVEREDVAVLVCDQRMPGMTGVEVCAAVRQMRPDVARVVLTAYADVNTAIAAINQGEVLRYLTKPWDDDELRTVLRSTIDLVQLQRTVRDLQVRILRGSSRAVESLSVEIAREMTEPLTAIEISAEQVRDLLDAGLSSWCEPPRAEVLVRQAREAQHDADAPIGTLKRLTDRLRRRQRPDCPPSAPRCDVAGIVRATAAILGSTIAPHAQLHVVLHASPVATIEGTQLAQILVQVLTNAAHVLATRSRGDARVSIIVHESDRDAVVRIPDSGPGISEHLRERVFDPYYSTSEGMPGLGLAVARRLAEQAGGSLAIEGNPTGGAIFVLRLPRIVTPSTRADGVGEASALGSSGDRGEASHESSKHKESPEDFTS